MPIRPQPIEKEYAYEEVLRELRKRLDRDYGGIAGFLGSEDFKRKLGGAGLTPKEKARYQTLLSLPKQGAKKGVKSAQTIQSIFKKIYGIEIRPRLVITRTLTLLSLNLEEKE